MSDGVFRFFNPVAPREDPKERRRRQLRQAQRTFRGRKELYARTLEKELDRIRVSEAQLMKQCARLQDEVESLTEHLARHGIASLSSARGDERAGGRVNHHPPASPPSTTSTVAATTGVSPARGRSATHTGHGAMGGGGGAGPRAVVKKSPYQPFPGPESCQHHEHYRPPSEGHRPSVCFSASPESQGNLSAYSTPQRGSIRVSDLELSVVGMEFVLILEDPCRGHLHGDPNKPYEATGHALTTSGRLSSISALPGAELPAGGPAGDGAMAASAHAARFAPPGLLDRLLRLSSDLAAENEVTPTQAWQYLRTQPRFADLELARVYTFARQLRDIIKCRGFGGVLDVGIFRRAMFECVNLGHVMDV